jgi:hypothetical protein
MATRRVEIESGCLSRVAEDEPVFVLRAHDRCAPFVVKIWAMFAQAMGVHDEKVAGAHMLFLEMIKWQERHGDKVPD